MVKGASKDGSVQRKYFTIGVGSTSYPPAFPDTKIGSPLLKMIDLRSNSLMPIGFMRILCVDKTRPETYSLKKHKNATTALD